MACIMKMTCKCHLVRPQKVLWMRHATEPLRHVVTEAGWHLSQVEARAGRWPERDTLKESTPRHLHLCVCYTPLCPKRQIPSKCSFPYEAPCLDFKVTGNRKFSGVLCYSRLFLYVSGTSSWVQVLPQGSHGSVRLHGHYGVLSCGQGCLTF